jgi:hypothetical protein
MRYPIVVILLACACALVGAAAGARANGSPDPPPQPEPTPASGPTQAEFQELIDRYRHQTWHWQRVMGRPVTLKLQRPPVRPEAKIRVWKQVAARARYVAFHPPHARAWACIHRYEGSWRDSGAPYYGGLQMDLGFQQRYGGPLLARKGTADHWTPLEQMWVAERALRAGRGFYPWPNTARYCGLI